MSAANRALRHPSFVLGAILSLALLAAALLSLVWTPWSPYDMDLANKLQPPSTAHWLGTDVYGRDIVSLLLVGARSSILVGVVAVGIGVTIGTLLGLLAAARRGWVEETIMRLSDFTLAFPAILSAIMLTAVYGAGMVNAMVAIGIYNIPTFTRLARGAAKSVWGREYILAARACGKGPWAITWQHVLPNISAVLIVQVTIRFAIAILAEAALSYLGLGTQPRRAAASKPSNVPMVTPMPTATTPTRMELRAPTSNSEAMSRPYTSVPSQWAALGGCSLLGRSMS